MILLALAAVHAHTALEDPPPRYPTDGFGSNKACPCGVGLSNRLCDIPTDRSDPDRGTDVTTYAPGSTIFVRWHEVVGHSGRFRIAFDPDGADMDDFNSHILLDIPDPAGAAGNTNQGDLWEVQVTLPSQPCDNCTLQLVQMMDGNTADPVPDPTGRSSYYQCSDIVIAPGAPTATGDTGVSMHATADTGSPGVPGSTAATASTGDTGPTDSPVHTGLPDTDAPGHTDVPDTDAPVPTDEPGTDGPTAPERASTCGCTSTQAGGVWLWLALLPLAIRARNA